MPGAAPRPVPGGGRGQASSPGPQLRAPLTECLMEYLVLWGWAEGETSVGLGPPPPRPEVKDQKSPETTR